MSSLVDDLLLLARLDSGRPLENRDVDLSEMVVNAVSDAHAASPSHTWALDVPGDPVVVHGDGARLHQLVANLLANARVHTGPGTTVKTSLARDDGHVLLAVHDNGPGIPAELQQNVFQRFARGDTLAQPGRRQHRPRAVDRRRGGPGPWWLGRAVQHARRHDLHRRAARRPRSTGADTPSHAS